MTLAQFDFVFHGGGPAGLTAAILLADAGARVAAATNGPEPGRVEGASPRIAALLSRLRLPLDGLGPALPRATDWGAMAGAANREHALDRHRFEMALIEAARQRGVYVALGRASRDGAGLSMADGRHIAAGKVIEARGRRAPSGCGRLRGPETIAILGRIPDVQDASAIQARPGGWVWRIAHPEGGTLVQVVTDPAGPGREGLARAWAQVLPEIGLPDGATARSAELRLTAPVFDPSSPRVGDAAIAMDPLSGHGLFWAVSSALMLPPLLVASDLGQTELARRYWRERAVATFWRQARIGRDFHRETGFFTPFWATRAAWPDNVQAHAEVSRPAVQTRVVVHEGRLAEAEVLLSPQEPDGAAFLAGRPLVPLLRALGSTALAGPETLAPHFPGRTAREIRSAFHWLVARGLPDASLFQASQPHSRSKEVLT